MRPRLVLLWGVATLAGWGYLTWVGAFRLGPWVGLAIVALISVIVLALLLVPRRLAPESGAWTAEPRPVNVTQSGADLRGRLLVHRFADTIATNAIGQDGGDRVQPFLKEAAAARLLDRHGIHLDHQPHQAEALLGAAAYQYLTGATPLASRRRAEQLDDILRRIEEL